MQQWKSRSRCLGAAVEFQPCRVLAPSRRSTAWCLPPLAPSQARNLAAYARPRRPAGVSTIDDLIKKHQPAALDRPRLSKETEEFWRSVAEEAVSKHTALAQLKKLAPDYGYPYGVRPLPRNGRKPPLFQEFLDFKAQHPDKVVLVRVGEFYETVGLDAVLLMQFCGLNPMGNRDIPAAGCPIANIRRTVWDLVQENGLSVIVCEEMPQDPKAPKAKKERYIAGVMTPAQPYYLHGLLEKHSDASHTHEATPPTLGVAIGARGFTIVFVNVNLRQYSVVEGQTEDAVAARLFKGGLAAPLYVHRQEQAGTTQITHATERWSARIRAFLPSRGVSVKHYVSSDPVEGLLETLQRTLGLPADEVFTRVDAKTGRKQPSALFYCTASQLGFHGDTGIPPLVKRVLPANTSNVQRSYMSKLLLQPPPPDVAASLRNACTILSELDVVLPEWTPMNGSQVIGLMNARQTNEAVFRELAQALVAARDTMQTEQLRPLAAALLPAVMEETGTHLELDRLEQACSEAERLIDEVIDDPPTADESSGRDMPDEGEGIEVLARYFSLNEEGIRNRVRPALIEKEMAQVEAAGERVEVELRKAFEPLRQTDDLAKNRATVRLDLFNNTVWLRVSKGTQAAALKEKLTKSKQVAYECPKDRNSKPIKDATSTADLDVALGEYRLACDVARRAVQEQLQALAARLKSYHGALVGATTFAVVASTMEAHVREATRQGWAQPVQLPPGDDHSHALSVTDMWPYWLDGTSPHTVRNTLSLDRMAILTGPNMAGKSTVMRNLCAVSVLAACGLYAPVAAAVVPYTDAFMLRTFSADSPIEGKSSFANEMSDMNHVMQDVSKHSLVLVDELGKGTEPNAGACIAAGFVEYLATIGCRGIFATHLHQMLEMKGPDFTGVEFLCMETREATSDAERGVLSRDAREFERISREMGNRVPTWKIKHGVSTESLAFAVMAQQCDNESVLQRALYFYELQKQPGARPATSRLIEPQDDASSSSDVEELLPVAASRTAVNSSESAAARSSSGREIKDAAELLSGTAARVFPRLVNGSEKSTTEGEVASPSAAATNGAEIADVQIIRRRQKPPSKIIGRSCVYVLRREDGYFYVGQTDNLEGRLKAHRTPSGKVSGNDKLEMAYVPVPSRLQGKSAAIELEENVIRSMLDAGFPMVSVTDGRRKRTPR